MKYIIDIPDDRIGDFVGSTHLLMPYFLAGHKGHHDTGLALRPYTEPDLSPLVDEAVEAIENEVWELADYMCRMSQDEKSRCFGFSYPSEVTTNLTYQEAKSLFEKWMEFNVGDEVIHNGKIKTVLCVFIGQLTLCDSDGHTYYVKREDDNIKKTGRHFPEVGQLLEKMREEE